MPTIENGPKALLPIRAIGAADARLVKPDSGSAGRTGGAGDEPLAVALSAATSPGEAPVDADRVAEIRKAIERGNYPVIPMRVADAMIAAGLLLRSE